MSKRAVVMSLLVGLGAALIWSTCGAASAAPQPTQVLSAATATPAQKTKLIFWSGYTGPDGEIMADLIKKYNETHPGVEVEVFTQQWTPLYEKFVVSFRSGNQPDIMSLMGTQDIPQFIELLEPVEPYMEKIGLRPDDFAKSAWEATRYEGRSYALPLGMPMHGVYYNKDLFDKAGIKPPTDWISGDEFVKIARALTTDKNGKHPGESGFDPQNVVQFGVGLNPNHHPFFQFYALLNQQGNRLLNDKRTALDFPDGDAVSAWQWLQDLFFKHYAAPPGQTAAATDFIAGKTAMMIEGVWQIPAIERAKMKWGTFPYPQVFKSKAVWGNIATFNLPKQSNARKKELAADFIGWILKNSLAWTRGGQHPALKSVAEMEEYKKYPGREGFRQSVPYVVVLPGIPNSAQFYSAAATSAIVTAAQNMLVQNKPVRASLEMMKSGLNALLK